jgi:acyl-homoserine-lactone acylase
VLPVLVASSLVTCATPEANRPTAYGNSTQPRSPHVGDQLELFARQEMRPVWRTRDDVEAHLEAREVF